LRVVALTESNTVPAAEVNGRNHLHHRHQILGEP
jgi:hypothetical protein